MCNFLCIFLDRKPGQLFQDDFGLRLVICVDVFQVPVNKFSLQQDMILLLMKRRRATSSPGRRRFPRSRVRPAIGNLPPGGTQRPSAPRDECHDYHDNYDNH